MVVDILLTMLVLGGLIIAVSGFMGLLDYEWSMEVSLFGFTLVFIGGATLALIAIWLR